MFDKALRRAKKDIFKVFVNKDLEIIYLPSDSKSIEIEGVFRNESVEMDQFQNDIYEIGPYIRVSEDSFKNSTPKTNEKIKVGKTLYKIKSIVPVGYGLLNLELIKDDT